MIAISRRTFGFFARRRAAKMAGTKSHPHDLDEREVDRALTESRYPNLLHALIAISRRTFGFFTRHYAHTRNYPWAVSRLEALPTGSRLLDIGAGVSPIPLLLAERGYVVECVDNSDITRTFPVTEDWNEWGYLDYGPLHPNLRSFKCAVEEFRPPDLYDAIYSISVVALMPTSVREATLRNARRWLKPGGLLVLAIDLIPGTDTLWNHGGSGESPEQHGSYSDLTDRLQSLGFNIIESRVERGVHRSRTDLAFLGARAVTSPSAADEARRADTC